MALRAQQEAQRFDAELAGSRPAQPSGYAQANAINRLSAMSVKYLYSVVYATRQMAKSQETFDMATKALSVFACEDFDNETLTAQTAINNWRKLDHNQKKSVIDFLQTQGMPMADQAYADHAVPVKSAIMLLTSIFNEEAGQGVGAVGMSGGYGQPSEEELVELPSVSTFDYAGYFGINIVRVNTPSVPKPMAKAS
ncbi:MAG: hypothetical protein KC475_02205 [Cyanobacteria bacterium HKST-UBA03]|nr:hypothetical protein [Cyanobacteria bacterium HKST-UBA03]